MQTGKEFRRKTEMVEAGNTILLKKTLEEEVMKCSYLMNIFFLFLLTLFSIIELPEGLSS